MELELAEGVLHVVLHGPVGQDEALGDLLVRQALRDEAQYLGLAVGEAGRVVVLAGGRGGEAAVLAEDEAARPG